MNNEHAFIQQSELSYSCLCVFRHAALKASSLRFPAISCFAGKWTNSQSKENENEYPIHAMHTNSEVSTSQNSATFPSMHASAYKGTQNSEVCDKFFPFPTRF